MRQQTGRYAEVSVNLLTNSMQVAFDADKLSSDDIIAAVTQQVMAPA